jgi:DHA1 family bicyclomycin/chloramphenicol resistance-like MFS transporter
MNPSRIAIPQGVLLVTLVLLSASGLVASDINLPGMPLAAHAFGTPISSMQHTFSVYIVGLALAQALYGPLSDAYGRRRLVIGGMLLYAAASIGCALAPNVEAFGLARVIQALGAGAGMVIGRAIVSDIFDTKKAAHTFTTIMPIVGASPALSPLVGGYITAYVSWRAPFLFTAALGVIAALLLIAYIPETVPKTARHSNVARTFLSYPMLLVKPQFWQYALNLCVGYAVYLGYLAASPVILVGMGLSTKTISYCYMSLSVTYIAGNLISRRLAKTYGIDRLIGVGLAILAAGALCLLLAGALPGTTPVPMILAMSVVALANGFMLPLSFAGGVTRFPDNAGAASGLMGAMHMIAGSLAIYLVAALPGNVASLAAFVTAVAAIGCVGFPLLLRWSRMPRRSATIVCSAKSTA